MIRGIDLALEVEPLLVRELVAPELGFLLVGERDLEALDLLLGVLGPFSPSSSFWYY